MCDNLGYDYIERKVAPKVVEFYVSTPQGHRVVRIYLDVDSNPRFTAFNETNRSRTPATLFLKEITALIKRATNVLSQSKTQSGECQ